MSITLANIRGGGEVVAFLNVFLEISVTKFIPMDLATIPNGLNQGEPT